MMNIFRLLCLIKEILYSKNTDGIVHFQASVQWAFFNLHTRDGHFI